MLALEDYTEWDAVGTQFEKYYDSTMLSPSSRFHLFFGQADPKEANTSSAAKYVYKILVTFSGTPVLSTDQTNISAKIGSDFKVTVNVAAEDSSLDSYVAQHLKWSSSDESVAEVDSNGKLTVKKPGTTVIAAAFGKSSVSVPVKISGGSGSDSGGQSPGQTGQPGQAGQSDQTGQKSAQEEKPADTPQKVSRPEAPEKTDVQAKDSSDVYQLSSSLMSQKEYAQWVQKVLKNTRSAYDRPSSRPETSNVSMSPDAQQLVVLMKKQPQIAAGLCVALTAVFLIGFAFGLIRFKLGLSSR
jgi:hypothetical protein